MLKNWWMGIVVMVMLVACDEQAKDAAAGSGSGSGSASASGSGSAVGSGSGSAVGSGSADPAAAIDAGAALDAAAAAEGYKVGDLVSSKWDDGYWYPGKIAGVNADGTYKIKYNDGYSAAKQKLKNIKPRKPPTQSTSGGGGGGGGCSGGRTKCGGRCVDLMQDNQNCSSCGRTCPEACMGGSCVSNAYKYGE